MHLPGMVRSHGRPDGAFHNGILQYVLDIGHRGIDMRFVQRQPLSGISLGSRPIPTFEALTGAPSDLLETALVTPVRSVYRSHSGSNRTQARVAVHGFIDEIQRQPRRQG
jgi:hypothetical protein